MKILILCLVIFSALTSCTSVKKYNEQIKRPLTEKQLKSDVDFMAGKLKKLHPDLYWYISKSELEDKFDSLKASISEPMTSNEFFLRISPVSSSVRQGHLQLFPLTLKYKARQTKTISKSGTNPLAKFEFKWIDSKLFVSENYSAFKDIKPGTEFVSFNNVSPQTILNKYQKIAASDGFNQTFLPQLKGKRFSTIYFWENGLSDSISCVINYRDTIRTVCLKRIPNAPDKKTKMKIKPTREDILARRNEITKKRIQGFNVLSGTYTRNLNFFCSDSTIAVMKIKDFTKGNYKKFYQNSFKTIRKAQTQTLILDLRDNPGGSLSDVATLYSYLNDSDFVFIDPPRVTSPTSLWYTNYFRGTPLVAKPFLLAFSPFRLLFMGRDFLHVRKDSCQFFYSGLKSSKTMHPQAERFEGKLYVLINGGSFSAPCILSSNLKGSKRATFVGEETGGAYNGAVAGRMAVYRLPHSKLKLRIGLMTIRPKSQTETDGNGILPDVEIKPAKEDLFEQNDPELNWILEGLSKNLL
jgi:hypothetical protein